MKLWLKFPGFEVKEVGYIIPGTRKVKAGFFLKPYEPTEVPDADAKEILRQNPHLVSIKQELFPAKKGGVPEDPIGKSGLPENDKNPKLGMTEPPAPEKPVENVEIEPIEIVREIAQIPDLKAIPSKQIREYGRKLGIKIPSNTKVENQIAMLEERCRQLVEEQESDNLF